jgi:cation transport ATPase
MEATPNLMPPERSTEYHSRAVEQRSESGGGLLGPVLTLVGIPVGWFVSTVAALIVLTYLIADLPPLVAGIGPTTTFYASVGVVVVIGFALLIRPATVFFGWLLMDILVAVAATFFIGWSTVIVLLEALSVVFIVPAHFFQLVEEAPDGFLAALALERWLR